MTVNETIMALAGVTREELGERVRRKWIGWALCQPDVADYPSWTVFWSELPERDREADMAIGEALFCAGWLAGHGATGGQGTMGRNLPIGGSIT